MELNSQHQMSETRLEKGLGRTAMGYEPKRWAPGSESLFRPADPHKSWALLCWPKGSDCQSCSADTAQDGLTQS